MSVRAMVEKVETNYWSAYICDSAIPGEGCLRPAMSSMRLFVSTGNTNFNGHGQMPGDSTGIVKAIRLKLNFSDPEMYPLVEKYLGISLFVGDRSCYNSPANLQIVEEAFEKPIALPSRYPFYIELAIGDPLLKELQLAEAWLRYRDFGSLSAFVPQAKPRNWQNWYAKICVNLRMDVTRPPH